MRKQNRNLPNSHFPEREHTVTILGSTGSIGCQTLDIIRLYPEFFRAEALTANTSWEKLAEQALEFRPSLVVIADPQYFEPLRDALAGSGIRVLAGEEGLIEAATLPEIDFVVGAMVGYSGLRPTIAALQEEKTVALANKETLVVGGEIIQKILKKSRRRLLLPVDSEHSAIFQCLMGEDPATVSKIILTASGGPFRNLSKDRLQRVTVEQALAHPNWHMGPKVTVDCATMMNKGFEMIEARWLFNMSPEDIKVIIHPESIIHSMVEFIDGSVKAQLSYPDMRLPIEVAMCYPRRREIPLKPLNLADIGSLTFENPDMLRFPLLGLAYAASNAGGLVPALMNAANEVAVDAFLKRQISFTDLSTIVTATVKSAKGTVKGVEVTPETIAEAHLEGTKIALELIEKKSQI